MLRKILILISLAGVVAGLQACAKQPPPEESCNFVQNSQWQRVSWGASVPVILYIDDRVPESFHQAIQGAAREWNTRIGREVIRVGITNQRTNPHQDGRNIIYYADTWEKNRSREQARTTVYWADDRIHEADIRLNAQDYKFFVSDTPVENAIDVRSLVLHEMGHVLGLNHAEAAESVMARTLQSATLRRELSSIDVESIRCEY